MNKRTIGMAVLPFLVVPVKIRYLTPIIGGVVVVALAGCSSTTTIIEKVVAAPTVRVTPTAHPVATHPVATHKAKPKPKTTHSTAPVATSAPAQPASPTLLVVGTYSGIDPTTLIQGATSNITGVTWSQWSESGAVGHGQQLVDNCQPNCASGTTVYVSVTVTLGGVTGESATSGGHYTTASEVNDQTGQPMNNTYGDLVGAVFTGASGGVQGN